VRALKPFTVEHFERYASRIVLDTGDYWQLEDFQGVSAEAVLTGPRECWSVLPEGNAKTTLLAGLALYCADFAPLPWIPVAASSRDQAEILAQQAYQMVRSSPGMLSRFRIYEGYRRIKAIRPNHPGPESIGIKVYAAEPGTGDGVIPYPLAICDEGHRHPDMRLYRLWRGKLEKRGARIAMISTAGEPGGEFEEMRDSIRDDAPQRKLTGNHLRCAGPNVILNEWAVQRAEQISDMEQVKLANPLASITVESLTTAFASPTVDVGDWKRLKCNIPSRTHNAAVSEVVWDEAQTTEVIPDGAQIDLGVDVAWQHDTFAIVPLQRREGFNLLGDAEILVPPRDGSSLHPDEVKIAFNQFFDHYEVETIVMDLHHGHDIAAWLEEHGVTVIDWSQGTAQKAEDYEAFTAGLRNGTLRHTGHSGLRAHVMHAVARAVSGDRRVFDRPSQSRAKRRQDERVIDALAAAAFVNAYAAAPKKQALAGSVSDYRILAL